MSDSPKTVRARWIGPFAADRGPGQPVLNHGDEADVLPIELESGHWEAVGKSRASAPKGEDE